MKANPEQLKICYIGGGSLNWAWVLMQDLAFEREISGTVYLYDIDLEAAKANELIGNQIMNTHNTGQWNFIAESSLQKSLEGSDFIFISILPGDFKEMIVDVHSPERYGIYQSVGDTVGPGGLNRALRIIPLYEQIARAIAKWAPDAWVFNYTNPMSVCTRSLYKIFPEIKAFGCCHEVFGTQQLLMKVLVWAGKAKEEELKRSDIVTNVIGINHFTWIDQASWKHSDLFPIYADFVAEFGEKGWHGGSHENWMNEYFSSGERVKMDLFKRYGLIAAAGDRHLAEFCPPGWYLKTPEMVKDWQFTLTPVSWRIAHREELKRKSEAYRKGVETFTPENSGEEGILQIKALLGLRSLVTNVNLPNKGQIPGLPAGAVVETNAVFSRDSVRPVITGGLPNPLENLILQHIENQEGIVMAAVERDLNKAFGIFLNDPQIRNLSREDAWELFKEMTSKTLPVSAGYTWGSGKSKKYVKTSIS
ncbi:MAG: alpha-glucosidase/alpha-galactosidase [Treponema sp.]|jgi:alpha-galactosidase|nr:alpha-glucosidase/alpha-galactosidase [Treponema sp.]